MSWAYSFQTVKNKLKLSKLVNFKLLLCIPLDACLHATPLTSSKLLGIVIFYLVIIITTEQQLHLRCNSSNTKIRDNGNGIALSNVSLSRTQRLHKQLPVVKCMNY